MGRKTRKQRTVTEGDAVPAPPLANTMDRLVRSLVAGLPALDRKAFNGALTEIKERPRASLHYLSERFTDGDAATRAIVGRVLAVAGGADVIDDLNATVFDSAQDPWIKVLANDLLEELGSPIDPDVFAMSVPDAGDLKKRLPSRCLRLLAEGKSQEAVDHARALEPAERYVIVHAAALQRKDEAVGFLDALSRDSEEDATGVVDAIVSEKLAGGVPTLQELQKSAGRSLQKLVKRALFDLRKAGIEVPEAKPRVEPRSEPAPQDEALPIYRAMMSAPSADGLVLILVARRRPTGHLKVLTVVLDLWKRGVRQAGLRVRMSTSAFERFVVSQSGTRLPVTEVSIEECRRAVARGVRVAREFGTPLPFDFGVGRPLLGDIDQEIAEIDNPFLCSGCEKPLDDETVARLRAVAPYENMHAETRCPGCRESA